jgi:uncharacterized protein (DUF433 family)
MRLRRAPELLEMPRYSTAMASRLAGLTAARVSRWLRGYEYTWTTGDGEEHRKRQTPIVGRKGPPEESYASFLDLMDLLIAKELLRKGLPLQRLRRALSEVQHIIGERHFAQEKFLTDGDKLFFRLRRQKGLILELLAGGQLALAPIIEQLAEEVTFDSITGYAIRWRPKEAGGLVLLDPLISFGQPVLTERRIPTYALWDQFVGENRDLEKVADWFGINTDEVLAAVRYEERLAAA